jgi:hypothetical protein
VDRLGQSVPSLDELKQIQEEARSSRSLKQLRISFERVQELRSIHSGNFDIQLAAAEAQEEIIRRAREIRGQSENLRLEAELFDKTSIERPTVEMPAEQPEEQAADGRPEPSEESRANWRRATYIALFLTAVILVVFFYLIQTARHINLTPNVATAPPKSVEPGRAPVQNTKAPEAPAAPTISPTLRLYTDLIPGTVSVDDGEPQDLKDGELVLDHLETGRHSIKVAGRNGTAEFSFDVSPGSAPQAVQPVTTSNAMAVLVSAHGGKGHLITSVQQPDISVDGKPVGQAGPDGLALDNLGTSDHELQLAQANDRQRFVMTYTAAPVLTVYIKSDLSIGTVTVLTKLDGVNVFVNDKPLRRPTDQGQLRVPLKVGGYVIRVHKEGFIDPPPQSVTVKKGEETELSFDLKPFEKLASLEVRDAPPGTTVIVDKVPVATVGADGIATAGKLKSGDHSIELRLEGSVSKKFDRAFQDGKTVLLSGADTALEKAVSETKPAPAPSTAVQPAPAEETGAASAQPIEIPGEHVRRGGGFVPYHTPKAAGHYVFQAHSKIGGFLKHDKLQWYAGYENSDNYVLFTLDGKHASIRQVKDGKSSELNRIPFNATSDQWVQVDLSVNPDAISARVRTPDSPWHDIGTATSNGRDFTQNRVGFYLPGNDEIAVANFHFSKR